MPVDSDIDLYDNLFTLEDVNDMPEDKTYDDYINPESVIHLTGCKLEPALAGARARRTLPVRAPGLLLPRHEEPVDI